MKLRTNFTTPGRRMVSLLTMACYGGALLALALAAFMLLQARSLRGEMPGLRGALVEARRAAAAAPKLPSLPSGEEIDALKLRVSAVNGLSVGGGSGASAILARLERLLPSGVQLVRFSADLQENQLELVAESGGTKGLSSFVAALERETSFCEVMLARQTWRETREGRWAQYLIRLRERRPLEA